MTKLHLLKNKFIIVFFLWLGASSIFASEPENIYVAKQAAIKYHDSGEHEKDINKAASQAKQYLQKIIATKSKLELEKTAIILDIDDTAIEEYDFLLRHDFSRENKYVEVFATEHFPAIQPILDLYNYAKDNQIKIFFITGRPEKYRTPTIETLKNAGYKNWERLYMRPNNDTTSAISYKSKIRKKIIDEGYDIALSIGDQESDLKGGYADKIIKLPNPFYYLP